MATDYAAAQWTAEGLLQSEIGKRLNLSAGLEQRLEEAFELAFACNWVLLPEPRAFVAAIAAVWDSATEEERQRLEEAGVVGQAVSQATRGIPIDLSVAPDLTGAIPLFGLWDKARKAVGP